MQKLHRLLPARNERNERTHIGNATNVNTRFLEQDQMLNRHVLRLMNVMNSRFLVMGVQIKYQIEHILEAAAVKHEVLSSYSTRHFFRISLHSLLQFSMWHVRS